MPIQKADEPLPVGVDRQVTGQHERLVVEHIVDVQLSCQKAFAKLAATSGLSRHDSICCEFLLYRG